VMVPHAEAVAVLEEEAQAQEDFNNELNTLQTEQANAFNETLATTPLVHGSPDLTTADEERAAAKEQYIADTNLDGKKISVKSAIDARRQRVKERVTKTAERKQ
jgi:hypothetical protein